MSHDVNTSNTHLYAMIIARDALFVQVLNLVAGPEAGQLWATSTEQIDEAIQGGLIDALFETDDV